MKIPGKDSKKSGLDLGCLTEYLGELKKATPAKQLAVSGAAGWITGMIVTRVGRAALMGIGVSAVGLHYAQKYGYLTVNSKKINQDLQKITEKQGNLQKKVGEYAEAVEDFLRENGYLGLGFSGGMFVGMFMN
ncbi:FUN14 domain-containing protein 2-like [Brevipalpus obovatus]|uniref:FUN14 domain-containing protein 2-like n=1 Tax=Brevipalpus obovatus TaxID=246614 RepID=UPI003D9FA432